MVRRKNSPLYDSFLLCRNSIRKDLSHTAHKRRNARFNGLWWVNTPPHPPNRAHSGSQGETGGVSGGGRYHYPRTVSHGSEPLRAQRSEEHTLPSLHGPRERRREAESLRNGDAHRARLRSEAPRPRRVALLHCCFLRCTGKLRGSLSLHPRAERKICCWGCLVFACGVGDSSLVTEVHFLNRCSRRSMRETYPLGQRSGCRS